MMGQRNLLFAIGGALALALLGVAAYLLYGGISQFARTETSLQKAKQELELHYNRDPFPSPSNVSMEQRNVEEQDDWFRGLMTLLRRGQIESQEKSPSIFVGVLGEKTGKLLKAGKGRIPEGFAFGFGRYFAKGRELPELPAPGDVPRLTEQLLIVESLCKALFAEQAVRLEAIVRQEFEGGPPGGGAGGGDASAGAGGGGLSPIRPAGGDGVAAPAPAPDAASAGVLAENALFGRYHFVLDLTARESAVLEVLNRLASMDLFVVVTGVWMQRQGEDVRPPPVAAPVAAPGAGGAEEGADGGAAATGAVARASAAGVGLYKRDRLVSGPQIEGPLAVRLELDVYKFREM
jgi:hypothetical protein